MKTVKGVEYHDNFIELINTTQCSAWVERGSNKNSHAHERMDEGFQLLINSTEIPCVQQPSFVIPLSLSPLFASQCGGKDNKSFIIAQKTRTYRQLRQKITCPCNENDKIDREKEETKHYNEYEIEIALNYYHCM
ncbi:hypothetical protein PVAND_004987 [Polypedilum vanderplanki]|uniref:Uncharacterized protein n=1 Tax=Polypedilum vanderplanki TaxID=319348 RepID=A0A9J6BYI8_POLVA|nr:hypothetical protein PVAND_004987 [Polypedilum vanderplanki]